MRILVAHNAYLHAGGEDAVVHAEVELLRGAGHEVELLQRDNAELGSIGAVSAAAQTLWSRRTTRDVARLVAGFRPQVVHAHNTFALISPSLYWACCEGGIPVVQTLHNFRLACPQAMFLREGAICEDCLGRSPWPAVRHACYRGSRSQTLVMSSMLMLHRALETWTNRVDRYIALNAFCRDKFIQAGLPADRICIKPNFVDPPVLEEHQRTGFLFVGRLSPEKGLPVLLDAWRSFGSGHVLSVAGTGPQAQLLNGLHGVRALGAVRGEGVMSLMQQACALVLPSICHEQFPRVLAEAMACGLPVIASRLGALGELVDDGRTGLLFNPGDAHDLSFKMAWALQHPNEMAAMGRLARLRFNERYTPARNLELLMAVYAGAGAKAAGKEPPAGH